LGGHVINLVKRLFLHIFIYLLCSALITQTFSGLMSQNDQEWVVADKNDAGKDAENQNEKQTGEDLTDKYLNTTYTYSKAQIGEEIIFVQLLENERGAHDNLPEQPPRF
jgi:hypothetical protein